MKMFLNEDIIHNKRAAVDAGYNHETLTCCTLKKYR